MRLFLEVLRVTGGEEERLGFPPFIIRLPVRDEKEAVKVAKEHVKRLMEALKIPPGEVRVCLHYCYHDETPQRPCEVKDVTEEVLGR